MAQLSNNHIIVDSRFGHCAPNCQCKR